MSPSATANASTASTASTDNAIHPGRHSVLAAGQEANHLPNPFPTFDILTDAAATQQERAVVMSTRGMRSSQIALALGVPPRTVRHWLARFRKHMAAERQAELAESLDQAIESYRAILAAAWESYESEQRIEHAILSGQLDRTRRRRIIQSPRQAHRTDPAGRADLDDRDIAPDAGAGASETILEETETPRRTNHGARYLSIALAAQREITRLEGLYDRDRRPAADIRLTVVERPATPDDQSPAPASSQPAPAPAPAPEPVSSAPTPTPTPTPTPAPASSSSPAPSLSPAAASVDPRPSAPPPISRSDHAIGQAPISRSDHAIGQPHVPRHPMRGPSAAAPRALWGEGPGVRPPLPRFRYPPALLRAASIASVPPCSFSSPPSSSL